MGVCPSATLRAGSGEGGKGDVKVNASFRQSEIGIREDVVGDYAQLGYRGEIEAKGMMRMYYV